MSSSLLEPVLPDEPGARARCLQALAVSLPRRDDDAGWLPLSRLLVAENPVTHWLRADLEAGACPSRRVVLSQLYKRLCLDLLAPVWVAALTQGRALSVAPERLWLRRHAHHDYRFGFGSGDLVMRPADETTLLAEARALVVALERLFRQQLKLGAASFWSSTALALVQPWIRLRAELDSAMLAPAAMTVLAQLEPRLCRYLLWAPEGETGAHFVLRRRGCCFKYQLPGEGYCGTCGLGQGRL